MKISAHCGLVKITAEITVETPSMVSGHDALEKLEKAIGDVVATTHPHLLDEIEKVMRPLLNAAMEEANRLYLSGEIKRRPCAMAQYVAPAGKED